MADTTGGAQPWWRRKLLWGVVVSVLLGAFSLVLEGVGAEVKLAALLTLLGIAVAVLVEQRFSSEESAVVAQERAASVSAELERLRAEQIVVDRHLEQFTHYASAPGTCREFVADIVPDWRRIDERSSVFLGWLRQDAEREFRVRLHELATGHGTVDRRSRHHFRAHPLIDFKRIRSVEATLTNYWNTGAGKRYLESQRTGIAANGLKVSRMFVVTRASLPTAREIIRRHVQAGVHVSIVLREETASDPDCPDFEDMSLVTDLSGVTGVLIPRSAGEPEIFTTEERQVSHAEDVVEFLLQYAKGVDDVYPS